MSDMQIVQPVMKPTSIESLKSYANGTIVQLPDFNDGQPFFARIRRPSIMKMASEGKIPNSLLATANALFSGSDEATDVDNEGMLPQMLAVCEEMAKATLIEPTYNDIVGAGLTLTDQQLIFLFNYSQGGVESLQSFRG